MGCDNSQQVIEENEQKQEQVEQNVTQQKDLDLNDDKEIQNVQQPVQPKQKQPAQLRIQVDAQETNEDSLAKAKTTERLFLQNLDIQLHGSKICEPNNPEFISKAQFQIIATPFTTVNITVDKEKKVQFVLAKTTQYPVTQITEQECIDVQQDKFSFKFPLADSYVLFVQSNNQLVNLKIEAFDEPLP